MANGPDIRTFLWFAGEAYTAAQLYVSIFPNSRIVSEFRSPVQTTVPPGEVLTCDFELNGRTFIALNGNTAFRFNEAISLVVPCDSQEEIDFYWSRLTADGGQEGRCGWLKDRFGISWQVTPRNMGSLIGNEAGMHAMMQMKKLDIAVLKAAAKS